MKKAFDHRNRQSVIEMFRPPAGYRLASAVGTTYSVDFIALTSIMLAFADAEIEDDHKYSVPQQLSAFIRLSEKMKLFVNRSSILLSGVQKSSRICAIYDNLIEEVPIANGSFHPKVWYLSFSPKDTAENVGKNALHRLVCSSRNVTMSNCWELAIVLNGAQAGRRSNSIGGDLARYFQTVHEASSIDSAVVKQAVAQLPSINFVHPPGAEVCRFDYQWPGSSRLSDELPSQGSSAVVVSPFLGKNMVKHIAKTFDETTLVSTRREIDTTLDEDLIKKLQPNLYYVNDDPSAEVDTRLSLHAKLYMFNDGNKQKMMLGSANASRNAWLGYNCEAMISISPGISQSNFMGDFVLNAKRPNELQPWIERYTIEDWNNREEVTEADKVDAILNVAQKTLVEFRFELKYDEATRHLTLLPIDKRNRIMIEAHFFDGFEIGAIPISLVESDNEAQWTSNDLRNAFAGGTQYSLVRDGIARLTQFVCFRILHRESKQSKTIILKSSRDNFGDLMESRNSELLRAELTAKQFAQFLASVLFDDNRRAQRTIVDILEGKHTRTAGARSSYFNVLIEDVLRSCTEDPSRVAEVTKIMTTFEGEDAEGVPFVDEDFRQFWNEFRDAFEDVAGV